MQKKQATKLEQLKHLKAAKNAQKQEEEVKQPKDFKQAKELKHPKQGRNTSCLPTSNTYQRSPLLNNETSQQSNISIFKHFNSVVSPHLNIWTTSYPGKTFS